MEIIAVIVGLVFLLCAIFNIVLLNEIRDIARYQAKLLHRISEGKGMKDR